MDKVSIVRRRQHVRLLHAQERFDTRRLQRENRQPVSAAEQQPVPAAEQQPVPAEEQQSVPASLPSVDVAGLSRLLATLGEDSAGKRTGFALLEVEVDPDDPNRIRLEVICLERPWQDKAWSPACLREE